LLQTFTPPARAFDRRHAALSILAAQAAQAVLTVIFALQQAREFAIPLVLSILRS